MISSTATMGFFMLITTIYFVLKYFLIEKHRNKDKKTLAMGLTFLYILIAIGSQVFTNVSNNTEICGNNNKVFITILYTVIPNILIFFLIITLLKIFPSWNMPFSNTFGYLFTLLPMFKLQNTFNEILKSESGNKLIQKIYEDKSLMINEITPNNFELFISKLKQSNLVKESVDNDVMDKLYRAIVIKQSIGNYIWYILSGLLVITTSYNSVMNVKCSQTSEQMDENQGKMAEKMKKLSKMNEKINIAMPK